MFNDALPNLLTDEQKGRICGVLAVGCDRITAANYVGCAVADIGHTMEHDPSFAANLLRTEAATEVAHMRNIQKMAEDPKNWRASVWWLERRAPERYGPRGAGELTLRQIGEFLDVVAQILCEEVFDEEIRQKIMGRLDRSRTEVTETVQSVVGSTTIDARDLLLEDLRDEPKQEQPDHESEVDQPIDLQE
jgi:hypothetical protein